MTATDRQDGAHDSALFSLIERFDQAGRWFMKRPVWFAALVSLALAGLPVAVWLDLRHLSTESLTHQASDLNAMISDIRSYYARNVINRVQNNNGDAHPVDNYEEIPGGIPIPATLSIELGEVIGGRAERVGYRFVSDEPFLGRTKRSLNEFEVHALKELRSTGNANDSVTRLSGTLFDRQIEMAVPVVMGSACVSCHNSHPESPKNDWKVGDIRGIQSVTIDQPIAANLFSFKYLLTYLALAGLLGLSFATLQWRQAVQFSAMNSDLEEANSFLAAVSMKISKYLSPQVYRSIFSGQKDAVISTERKKLTIFFSDIMDFTVTTERLQPEELTELLNEYFTEMSEIAHAYGATVDKFIGDAILAFFGDPETRGASEDALTCVNMAIAMQRRLDELSLEWRRRGLEMPFQARMGINSGYCNVGNFGSEDRMDYTIIGAEANLAARLESIAEPGGIVISYETYALVQDHISVRKLEPIALKGISRQIVPYAVENIHLKDSIPSDSMDYRAKHMQLHLDLADISDDDRRTIERELSQALRVVRGAPA